MLLKKKFPLLLASLFCALLVLSACSSDDKKESAKKSDAAPTEIKVTDAMGEQTIPVNPKRVLAPFIEDYLVTLGIKPVSQWSIGTSVQGYLQDSLKDVPLIGWDMPIEDVIAAEPDLIIFGGKANIQEGKYEEYTKVAPVYVVTDEDVTDWKKQLNSIAKIFNKEDVAKKAIADYEAKATDAQAKVKEAIGDESAAYIWVVGGQFYILEQSRYSANVLYNDLGITVPKFVSGLGDGSAAWQATTLEALAELDADHVFISALPDEAGLKTLQESSIWKNTPAAKAGNVYINEDSSNWTVNAKTANSVTIDMVLEALAK